MIELPQKMAIDGTQDVIRAFTKLNFVIGYIPVAKLTTDSVLFYQISCLPKFTYKQQVMLAVNALLSLGFRNAGILIDATSVDPNKRHTITASHSGISVTYHIDLGLLEITIG